MSIHTITDLDKISITEAQGKLVILRPAKPRFALVYTRATQNQDLSELIKNAVFKTKKIINAKVAAQSIRSLKQLLANETLDSQAQFDLKRLIDLCGSQSIKSLFDLGFDPKKEPLKAADAIHAYFGLLGPYAADYHKIEFGEIVLDLKD